MESLRSILPAARSLVVFEAAGRQGSFTRAAEELGITQAAVSLAVRNLEERLDLPLFVRRHRAVELTEAGKRFHADVSFGLTTIRKSAGELRSLRSERHVTLSASTAFASLWMLPRLPRFREDLPDIDLRIQTSDRDIDILGENVPLAIRAGRQGSWPGCESALFAEEKIQPIVSPAYIEQFGMPETDAHIALHRLIHLEEPFRPAMDWTDWFAARGLSPPAKAKGLLINDHVLVMQAVLAGQGIGLGWHHLSDHMVQSGQLLRLGRHPLSTGNGFFVVWPAETPLSDTVRRVRDWLLKAPPAG